MDVLNTNNFTNTLSAFLKNRNSFGDINALSQEDATGQNLKMILDNSLNQNFDINSMLSNAVQKAQANLNVQQLPVNPFKLNASSPSSNVPNNASTTGSGSPNNLSQYVSPSNSSNTNSSNTNSTSKRLKTSTNSSKSGTKKSFVWKYFKHPMIDGVIDRSRTQCLLCDSQLAFNASGTTTTMLNHLKSRHGEIAETEENIRRVNRSFNQSLNGNTDDGANLKEQSPSFKVKSQKLSFDNNNGTFLQTKKQSRMNKSKIDLNDTLAKAMNSANNSSNNPVGLAQQRNNLLNSLTRNFNGINSINPNLYSEMNQGQDFNAALFNLHSQLNLNPLTQNFLALQCDKQNQQQSNNNANLNNNNNDNFIQNLINNMNSITSKNNESNGNSNIVGNILNSNVNPFLKNLGNFSQNSMKPFEEKQLSQLNGNTNLLNSNFLMNLMNFLPPDANSLGNNGPLNLLQTNLSNTNSDIQSINDFNKSDQEEDLPETNLRSDLVLPSFVQKSPLQENISYKRKHSNDKNQKKSYPLFHKAKLDIDEGNATDSDQNTSKRDKMDQDNFQHSLTYFLVKDLNSVDIIEGCGFKRLWNFNLPTAMKIRHKYMQDLQSAIRMKLISRLDQDKIFNVNLLVDIWELENDQTFCSIGFSLNYKNNSTCEEFLWKTQLINPNELSTIYELIKKCLEEINFNRMKQEVIIVTSNRHNLIMDVFKSFGDSSEYKFIVMPCLLSTFNDAVEETLESLKLSTIYTSLQKNIQKLNRLNLRRERRSSQLSGDSENSSSVQSVDSNIEFQDGNNNSAVRDHSTDSILSTSYNLTENLKNLISEKTEISGFNSNEFIRIIKTIDEMKKYFLSNRTESISKLLNYTLKKISTDMENNQESNFVTTIYDMITNKILERYQSSPETTLLIDQIFLLDPNIKTTLFHANKTNTYNSLVKMISDENILNNFLVNSDLKNMEILDLSKKFKALSSPYSCILGTIGDGGCQMEQIDFEYFLKKRKRLDPKDVDIYTFLNKNWQLTY